ncbi:MAG: hypothetical protein KatS3mg076_3237 [Candidatus Binatia bacterium]|nr:MAG: hypothetical protein KatS3mg076_3237 [Candidatus Binatia bacterium]
MTALLNVVRIALAGLWTALLGLPLLATIYSTYAYGLVRSLFGRKDILDRILEWNARLAGTVAQKLWSGVLLALGGIRVRVRELKPVDWTVSHVVCANHASLFDVLALVRVIPPPFRFVAKRELLRWPIIGWALRPAGQIVIDRANRAKALGRLAREAVRKIPGQVVFFVEGTRSKTGRLQPFKKGAFHFSVDTRLPILPAAIAGSYAVLAKLPWWRMQPGREIEVTFCPPIDPPPARDEEEDRRAVESLLRRTYEQIRDILEPATQPAVS